MKLAILAIGPQPRLNAKETRASSWFWVSCGKKKIKKLKKKKSDRVGGISGFLEFVGLELGLEWSCVREGVKGDDGMGIEEVG